jgi:hypothetical protein
MDPDNLGRVFAPTLFRPLPSSQEMDPITAFQEVNLQKVVIKYLISQYLDQTAELSISSFQLNDRMMSRMNRGQEEDNDEEDEEGEGGLEKHGVLTHEEVLPRCPEQLLQDKTPFETSNVAQNELSDELERADYESGEDERYCIVSSDLRSETRPDISSLRLSKPLSFTLEEMELELATEMNQRDETYAAALNNFRRYRQEDEATAGEATQLSGATEIPLVAEVEVEILQPEQPADVGLSEEREEDRAYAAAMRNLHRYRIEDDDEATATSPLKEDGEDA